MLVGMTGFGSAEKMQGGKFFTVEIKSQNHRYLDLVFFLPSGLATVEAKLREILSKKLQRGRVTVSLKMTDNRAQRVVYDRNLVKEYLRYAAEIKNEFGLVNNVGVADVFRFPGILEMRETRVDSEDLWPAIQACFLGALRGAITMRRREGRALALELRSLLLRMAKQVKKIETRAKFLLVEKNKVSTREEYAAYHKSTDIREEITRLEHYITEAKLLLCAKDAVGKKLDFVAQEMQRETNTIGSKLQDQVVSSAVIALKSKIEKVREQAQNIE